MTDLVRLEDVLAVCSAYCPDDDGSCSKAGHDLREMLDEIEALPTIESQARHGHWIMLEPYGSNYTHRRKCSECGEIKAQALTNFCPDCGADMREDMKCNEGN